MGEIDQGRKNPGGLVIVNRESNFGAVLNSADTCGNNFRTFVLLRVGHDLRGMGECRNMVSALP
jgi:hypothetical protein